MRIRKTQKQLTAHRESNIEITGQLILEQDDFRPSVELTSFLKGGAPVYIGYVWKIDETKINSSVSAIHPKFVLILYCNAFKIVVKHWK